MRLRAEGVEQMRAPEKRMQICSFLWVYYGFPTSTYENRNVEQVRFEEGRLMADSDHDTEVDCVCGIPDSGVGMALGYAAGRGISYQRAISNIRRRGRAASPEQPEYASACGQDETDSQQGYA